jgi:hypothetical protein
MWIGAEGGNVAFSIPGPRFPAVLVTELSALHADARTACKSCGCSPCCCKEPDPYPAVLAAFTIPKILAAVEAGGLTVTNNLVAFDQAAAIAAGVSAADAGVIADIIHGLNQLVAEGALQVGDGADGWRQITPKAPMFLATSVVNVTIAGTNYAVDYSAHWYGHRLTLNKAATGKLCELIALGGSAAALAAALAAAGIITAPADIPLGVLTALLFFGAAVVRVADMCKGVSLIFPWVAVPPVPAVVLIPNL